MFAVDDLTEGIFVVSSPEEEHIDYSDMSNWAYWNKGNEKNQ